MRGVKGGAELGLLRSGGLCGHGGLFVRHARVALVAHLPERLDEL
jgi:hypothetical protein